MNDAKATADLVSFC